MITQLISLVSLSNPVTRAREQRRLSFNQPPAPTNTCNAISVEPSAVVSPNITCTALIRDENSGVISHFRRQDGDVQQFIATTDIFLHAMITLAQLSNQLTETSQMRCNEGDFLFYRVPAASRLKGMVVCSEYLEAFQDTIADLHSRVTTIILGADISHEERSVLIGNLGRAEHYYIELTRVLDMARENLSTVITRMVSTAFSNRQYNRLYDNHQVNEVFDRMCQTLAITDTEETLALQEEQEEKTEASPRSQGSARRGHKRVHSANTHDDDIPLVSPSASSSSMFHHRPQADNTQPPPRKPTSKRRRKGPTPLNNAR